MTANHIGPTNDTRHVTDPRLDDAADPVPEADRLEQLTPVDPAGDTTADAMADPALAPGARIWAGDPKAPGPGGPVDEADWLEQQHPVPATDRDDEDYPPELSDSQ